MRKEGQATLIGCGLCPAGGADVAGWNADFFLLSLSLKKHVEGQAHADTSLSLASPAVADLISRKGAEGSLSNSF